MRSRQPPPALSWERILALHEQDGDVPRACANILRTISLDQTHADVRSLLLTSAVEAEGKTTMALHLAATLATHGKRVLLIDAHWRRPSLSRVFGAEEQPGLTDLLETDRPHEKLLVQDARLLQLFVLPRGSRNELPLDSAASDRMGALLQRARGEFDFVLLDAAPTASGPDVLVPSRMVDGVLLVVACDRTQRREVVSARRAVEKSAGKLVGVILSRVPRYLPAYYRTA